MDDLNVLKKYIGEKIKSIEENNKKVKKRGCFKMYLENINGSEDIKELKHL